MKFNRAILATSVGLLLGLSGCGGGGVSLMSTSNSMMNAEVSISAPTISAGQSASVFAQSLMRASTPSSMKWSVTPITPVGANEPIPTFSDINCATASFMPPAVTAATGQGTCRVVFNVSPTAKSATWRITNVSTNASNGSVSASVDVDVVALAPSGFAIMSSPSILTGYVNKKIDLSLPFTTNANVSVSNVKYTWTGLSTNPSKPIIAGSTSSSAVITPVVAGQYLFNVVATADVNGVQEQASGSINVNVYSANVVDIISAGSPRTTLPASLLTLTGAIINQDSGLSYATSWSQVDGLVGGPVRVSLNRVNATSVNFIAPMDSGVYVFEMSVEKTQADGVLVVTKAQTSVTVNAIPSGVFLLTPGAVQSVTVNSPVTLTGAVTAQGTIGASLVSAGVLYEYVWTQSSANPVQLKLSNANGPSASFIAGVSGPYNFTLTVTAVSALGRTTVSADTQVVVTPSATAVVGNIAIAANAGLSQSVSQNSVVSLPGVVTTQGVTTGTTYAYQWSQIGVTPASVAISNATSATASFFSTIGGNYSFKFTVTATLPDGTVRTATSDTQVIVGGVGNAFSVSAGNAQSIGINAAASMVGSTSTQGSFTGAIFTYAWTQVGVIPAAVIISNASSLTASFVPTVLGTYTFLLTATSVQGGVTLTQTAQTQVLAF